MKNAEDFLEKISRSGIVFWFFFFSSKENIKFRWNFIQKSKYDVFWRNFVIFVMKVDDLDWLMCEFFFGLPWSGVPF